MKNLIWGSALVLALLALSCGQKQVLTRDEVLTAIKRFDEGWQGKDSTVVNKVLSPSYVYFTQSGGIFSRSNILHTSTSPEYLLQKMDRDDYVIHIQGNTAVVSTIWRGKGTYRGEEFDDRQRCSITLVKNKGKVEILSEHCTPLK
jgi:hypothetical protein